MFFSGGVWLVSLVMSSLDKTVKLWKVFEKSIKVVSESNLQDSNLTSPLLSSSSNFNSNGSKNLIPGTGGPPLKMLTKQSLRLPKLIHHDTMIAAIPRKIYQNAHAYHINSISVNSDGETYLSADDLRINLWNLNISDQSFS